MTGAAVAVQFIISLTTTLYVPAATLKVLEATNVVPPSIEYVKVETGGKPPEAVMTIVPSLPPKHFGCVVAILVISICGFSSTVIAPFIILVQFGGAAFVALTV